MLTALGLRPSMAVLYSVAVAPAARPPAHGVLAGRRLCSAGEHHAVGHMTLACLGKARGITELVLFKEHCRFGTVDLLSAGYSNHFLFSFSHRLCNPV